MRRALDGQDDNLKIDDNMQVDIDYYNRNEMLNSVKEGPNHEKKAISKLKDDLQTDIRPNIERGNAADGQRTKHDPVVLSSGAVYHGEWLDGQRDGYGV